MSKGTIDEDSVFFGALESILLESRRELKMID